MWRITLIIPPVWTGFLVRKISLLNRPRWFVDFCINILIKKYDIDINLISKPVADYPNLLAFFLRELKPSARPLASESEIIMSPVDARISAIGKSSHDQLILVKGNYCTIPELIERPIDNYDNSQYLMLYLSPGDCHRIYAPADAKVVDSWYIAGGLKPVLPAAVKKYPKTFITNKRVITELQTENGKILVVKVGATNVGRIPVKHPLPFDKNKSFEYKKGQEIGSFEFGSTVILLFEKDKFEFNPAIKLDDKVNYGQSLANFKL